MAAPSSTAMQAMKASLSSDDAIANASTDDGTRNSATGAAASAAANAAVDEATRTAANGDVVYVISRYRESVDWLLPILNKWCASLHT